MDAHLFRRFCHDLLPALIGCRIEKIYQAADGLVTFPLYGFGNLRDKNSQNQDCDKHHAVQIQKYYLTFKEGKDSLLFLSHSRVSSGAEPPAFVMRLRKYLTGRHIKTAAANWLERKIILEVSQGDESVWLSLDLRHGMDLHFSCPDGALVSPNTRNEHGENIYLDFDRSHKLVPSLTDKDFYSYWFDFAELSEFLENTAKDRAKDRTDFWKSYPTLTPPLRKSLPYLDKEEQAALYADLQFGGGDVFVYTGNSRVLGINQSVENTPFAFSKEKDSFLISAWKLSSEQLKDMGYPLDIKELVFEDSLEAFVYIGDMALALFQKQASADSVKNIQSQLKRLARLELKLEEEEIRLARLAEKKEQALLLQANLYQFSQQEKQAQVIVFNQDGQEIAIALDKAKTVRENMEQFFHASSRGMRGLEHLIKRKQDVEQEKQALLNKMWEEQAGAGIKDLKANKKASGKAEKQTDCGLLGKVRNVNNQKYVFKPEQLEKQEQQAGKSEKKQKANLSKYPKEVQVFRSSDGFMILRGRDTKGNALALKMASPNDIWVHIAEGVSAHVIIRRDHAKQEVPPQTMQEAGTLALMKSMARGQESGTVQYSYAKYIRPMKTSAKSGKNSSFLVHVDRSEGTFSVRIVPEYEENLKIS